MKIQLSLLLIVAVVASQETVVNEIYIKEEQGVSTTNYPMQIGRVFIKGEIPNFPQVVIGTTPVFTQADVKTRWDDGSVYHAVLSFFIPYLGAHQNLTNQLTGNNAGFLDKAGIVAFPDFGAQIDITSGGITKSVNLRQMINANAGFYWLVGPVATSIVVADHSVNRTFDIGFDNYRQCTPTLGRLEFVSSARMPTRRMLNEKDGPKTVSPLSMWKTGNENTAKSGGFNPGMVKKAESPWMNNFLILEVGRTLELGFTKTEGILNFHCRYLNGMLSDPGYNPYLIQEYRIPTIVNNSANPEEWFQTWADVKACYKPEVQNTSQWDNIGKAEHDYRLIALAATSQCAYHPNGAAAWTFMSPLLDHWAITPSDREEDVVVQDNAENKGVNEEVNAAGHSSKLGAVCAVLYIMIALV